MHGTGARERPQHKHWRRFTAAVAWMLVAVPCLRAQQSNRSEYEVKAAYLYNFGSSLDGPAQSARPGVLHHLCTRRGSFGATLDKTIAGESINGRRWRLSGSRNRRTLWLAAFYSLARERKVDSKTSWRLLLRQAL